MKQRTRKLLVILPLLPFLMANSPAPRQEDYKDLEVTYVSEESLYTYNFYRFNVKNTGNGYLNYIYLNNQDGDNYFGAYIENNEILPPFDNVLIEPGFDRVVIVATKNKLPDSKIVKAECSSYFIDAENVAFNGDKKVSYVSNASSVSNHYHVYTIQAFYSGETSGNYNYRAVLKFTYDGVSGCVLLDNIDNLRFTTNEQLDLTKLTVEDVLMVRDTERYNYYNNGFGENLGNAFAVLLIFLLVFGLLLSFGIFSAIFFPAMARRRRQRALQQNNK